ncbi:MAG: LCP family protein, partial [Ruminococcus sp.]|nr:LCP family protein [Ruminococcus sp.]
MNRDENSRYNQPSDDYGDGYYSYTDKKKKHTEYEDIYSSSRYGSYFDEPSGEYEDIYSNSSSAASKDRRSSSRSEKTRKKKKRLKKFILSLVCILLVAALIVCGGALIFVGRIASKVNYVDVDEKYSREALLEDGGASLASHDRVLNILLLGVDEDTSEYGRSDSMMLVSIDKKHKKLKLTSFQRDTFVYVPDPEGGYRTKLTNAYSWGGVGLAMRTIEYNFGIRIDNYVTVNFETFKTIVDILGGVELELTDREILYINCQIAQNNQTEYLDAEAGKVLLNGQQALWHARNRGGDVINGVEFYEGTDWDRTQRQRNFMQALIKDVKKASPFKLLKIADSVSEYITTDIEKAALKKLLISCLVYRTFEVSQASMPSDDTWGYEDNFAGNVIAVYDWEQVESD